MGGGSSFSAELERQAERIDRQRGVFVPKYDRDGLRVSVCRPRDVKNKRPTSLETFRYLGTRIDKTCVISALKGLKKKKLTGFVGQLVRVFFSSSRSTFFSSSRVSHLFFFIMDSLRVRCAALRESNVSFEFVCEVKRWQRYVYTSWGCGFRALKMHEILASLNRQNMHS